MKQELTIPAMKEIFEFHYYLSNRRSKTYLSSAINIVGKSRLLVFQQNIVILNFGCEKSFLDISYFPAVSRLIVAVRGAMNRIS